MTFKKATRKGIWMRLAITSPSGGGKTWTALVVADKLAKKFGYKIAVLDTERGSASKYASHFNFDVMELYSYEIQRYMDAISDAEKNGYKILIVDSLTHAWAGEGGLLDKHQAETLKSKSGNSYMAWAKVTPLQNRLIDAMLNFNGHLIATMRTKTDYILDGNKPKKVGMAPIQRDGMEYEFDIVGDMDIDHNLIITKTRCHELADMVFKCPGKYDNKMTDILIAWVGDEVADNPHIKPEDNKKDPMLILIEAGKSQLDGMCVKYKSGKEIKAELGDDFSPEAYLDYIAELITKYKNSSTPDVVWKDVLPKIHRMEMMVYPVAKAVNAAHKKHLDGGTPGELGWCDIVKKYKLHLEKKCAKLEENK